MTVDIPDEHLSYMLTARTLSELLDPDDVPDSFAIHLPFDLRQGGTLVARVHVSLIRLGEAERWGFMPAEVFDHFETDSRDLYRGLFDTERGTLRRDLVEPTSLRDVLYVESVKVIPSRRKQNLGLRVVERFPGARPPLKTPDRTQN